MYLKRIEAFGFKSFAKKTVLSFEKGVTAIVGPNGSGKSNVSDSIRFVLGEQSVRNLRGAKMDDVIFSGTDGRKALNYAEVTIVLDNSAGELPLEFSEVSVTRRVFRDGGSEYQINGEKVRLRDVADLIMDTGIGHDSLSMISQDHVKKVVDGKPEDRRYILEEAAGILKYKVRKKEATRKLDSTTENLNRVKDIINELEVQVEPLREQSSEAKKYLEVREELANIEVSMLAHDIKGGTDRLGALKSERLDLEVRQMGESKKIDEAELAQIDIDGQLNQKNSDIEAGQEELVAKSELIQQLIGRTDVLKERLKNESSNIGELEAREDQLGKEIHMVTSRLIEAGESAQAAQADLEAKKSAMTERQTEIADLDGNMQERLSTEQAHYFELTLDLNDTKNRYVQNEEQLGNLGSQNTHVSGRLKDLKAAKGALDEAWKDLESKEVGLKEKLQALRADFARQKKTVDEKGERVRNEEANNQQAKYQLDSTKSRLQWLLDAQSDFSGFTEGAKQILRAGKQGQVSGVLGAVAELVTISDDVQVAMDVVLGPVSNQIVTVDDTSAKKAIAHLKSQRAGRATFLPLNVIKGRKIPTEVVNAVVGMDGFVGVASELVKFDNQYRNIFENLLGNVVVAKDIDVANVIAAKLNRRFRVVTLAGDVINPGGSMTGGQVRRTGNTVLKQRKDIENQQNLVAKLGTEIADFANKQSELDAQFEVELTKLERLETEGTSLNEELATLHEEKLRLGFQKEASTRELEQATSESSRHETLESDLITINNNLAEKRVTLESQISVSQAKITDLEEKLHSSEFLKSELETELTSLKIEVATLEAKFTLQSENVERLETEAKKIGADLETIQARIKSIGTDSSENDDLIASLNEQIESEHKAREALTESIATKRAEVANLSAKAKEINLSLQESRKFYSKLGYEMNAIDVESGKLDVSIDLNISKLETEYEMTVTHALEHYPMTGDVGIMRQKISNLTARLSQFGEVNLGAIAEFERVSERYNFLTTEREDLLKASDDLQNSISEMDGEMTLKFKETFDLVRTNYIEIFRQLYNGGTADLMLTDPDDLLNTGIEIIARPPGTKLRTSNLLSGGQKALTSIALLFAVLKVRTVPFCILDEVEAALDEANVARYASYLKKFSDDTQFIVITHRRGTMEKADTLYGVTMQERGVTTLVSVRMDDVEKYLDE